MRARPACDTEWGRTQREAVLGTLGKHPFSATAERGWSSLVQWTMATLCEPAGKWVLVMVDLGRAPNRLGRAKPQGAPGSLNQCLGPAGRQEGAGGAGQEKSEPLRREKVDEPQAAAGEMKWARAGQEARVQRGCRGSGGGSGQALQGGLWLQFQAEWTLLPSGPRPPGEGSTSGSKPGWSLSRTKPSRTPKPCCVLPTCPLPHRRPRFELSSLAVGEYFSPFEKLAQQAAADTADGLMEAARWTLGLDTGPKFLYCPCLLLPLPAGAVRWSLGLGPGLPASCTWTSACGCLIHTEVPGVHTPQKGGPWGYLCSREEQMLTDKCFPLGPLGQTRFFLF